MPDSDYTPPPGNTEANLLVLIFLILTGWSLIVMLFDQLSFAVIPTVYALPLILALSLFLAIRLACKGTARVPALLAVTGILYIVGGGTFDMVATVLHTPELDQEANMIARALLDSGHPLEAVYGYAIITQTLMLALISTLWISLLRHRDLIITAVDTNLSFMQFIKAATGGARLNWRQWLIPLKMSELPWAYPLLWVLVVTLVAGVSDRWYLGFEWFDLVSSIRWICVGVALFVGLLTYFVWLWTASRLPEHTIE